MDALDRDVLLALQANDRMSNLALARSPGITARAIVVARLREHSERSIREFEKGIRSVPGVRACYHATGQFDMVVELALRDLDLEGIERSITPRTRLLILNDLHNPTAAECTPEELARLAELAVEHDLWS